MINKTNGAPTTDRIRQQQCTPQPLPREVEEEIIARLTQPLASGETAHEGNRRREQEVGEVLAALDVEVIAEIDQWFASRGFAPSAKRSSLRLAIIAASGIAISLTALGAWYRWWRSGTPPAAHDAIDVSTEARTIELERPTLAVGTRPKLDAGIPDAMLEPPVDTQSQTVLVPPPAAPSKATTKIGVTPPASKRSRTAASTSPSEKEVTSKLGRGPAIGVGTFVKDVAPVKP